MNSLLHSKRFKKNLYKWLMMYFGVLCMLTIVVTYSKYISTYTSNPDTAKVAKFDIDMTYSCVVPNSGESCNIINSRPVSQLEYYFTIKNKSDVATTLIVTNIKVHEDFEIASLENIVKTGTGNEKEYEITSEGMKLNNSLPSNSTNTYKIILNYKNYKTNYYKEDHSYIDTNNVLTIGYSATNVGPKKN